MDTELAFRDFIPLETERRQVLFTTVSDFQPLEKTLSAANAWIQGYGIDVINIETVVLPNMHREDGSTDTAIRSSGEHATFWHQFIRVWYRKEKSLPPPIPQ